MLKDLLGVFDDIVVDIESNHAQIHQADWQFWGCGFCHGDIAFYTEVDEEIRAVMDHIRINKLKMIAHNSPFDLRGLHKTGFFERYDFEIIDTMVGMNLVDPLLKENQLGLKYLVKEIFGHQMKTYEESSLFGRDSKEFYDYGKEDVYWTWRLWKEIVEPQLMEKKLDKLFFRINMQDNKWVAEQEDRGVMWDCERAHDLMGETEKAKKGLCKNFAKYRDDAQERAGKILGYDINLNSGTQVGKRMFDDLGYDSAGVEKTKKKQEWSITKDSLEMLATRYPVAKDIREFRNSNKMITTYLGPNTEKAESNDLHRIYPSIRITSKSGRKRQADPNFQNQPVISDPDLNIRSCVIAPPGFKLLVMDLSQMELRLVAHISKDETMIRQYCTYTCKVCGATGTAETFLTHCPGCGVVGNEKTIKDPTFKGFWHGLDIHGNTAKVTGLPRSGSSEKSASAKNVNFALVYNATPWKLWMEYGTHSLEKWEEISYAFFDEYKGVKRWHMHMAEQMNAQGMVRDIFGRMRVITRKEIHKAYKHALNMFINAPVQTSGANYLMLAKREIRNELIGAGVWMEDVFPSNEVHDELIVECREEYVPEVSELMLEKARYCVPLRVPVNAELLVVNRWGHAKG